MKQEIRQILKKDNFSIIEIRKGTLTTILYLHYLILKEIRILENLNTEDNLEFNLNNIKDEILQISQKFKKTKFFSLGAVRPDLIHHNFIDLNGNYNKSNKYEETTNIRLEDFE